MHIVGSLVRTKAWTIDDEVHDCIATDVGAIRLGEVGIVIGCHTYGFDDLVFFPALMKYAHVGATNYEVIA